MTTLTSKKGNVITAASPSTVGLLDRLVDWMNHVVDAICGPAVGGASHDNPAETYLFLNPTYCGAQIDSDLWDLLNDERNQPAIEEVTND